MVGHGRVIKGTPFADASDVLLQLTFLPRRPHHGPCIVTVKFVGWPIPLEALQQL